MDKEITILKGKAIREIAQRLTSGKFRIERETLNRYAVFEGNETPDQAPVMYLNRVCFVRLDCEIYKIQARQNPIAAGIEKALDNDSLEFCISKNTVDKMQVKLIARTFSSAKVAIENVSIKMDNYIIHFTLVPSVSERDLTQKELEIAEYFIKANTDANANAAAGTPETETKALPEPETATAVDTTAKVIPAK